MIYQQHEQYRHNHRYAFDIYATDSYIDYSQVGFGSAKIDHVQIYIPHTLPIPDFTAVDMRILK